MQNVFLSNYNRNNDIFLENIGGNDKYTSIYIKLLDYA